MKWTFPVAATLLLLAWGPVHAQAEITAIALGSEPVERTGDLRISRFADFSEETVVAVGAKLGIGDLLSSVSGATSVEVTCAEAVLQFSGGFRVLIDDPDRTRCAVDFLSGDLDVLTDQPVEIDSGDVTMGNEGTQFSVSLTRTARGPDHQLVVFDGSVEVRSAGVEDRVVTGRTWRLVNRNVAWGELSEADAERSATVYARMEVARSVAAGKQVDDAQKSIDDFKALHKAVLLKPEEERNRVSLAKAQLDYGQDGEAAYHLNRVDVTTKEKLESYQLDQRVLPLLNKERTPPSRNDLAPVNNLRRTDTHPPDPFALIQNGQFERAIAILQQQARDAPNSKALFGLATAHAKMEGTTSATAADHAKRALAMNERDRILTEDQVRACREILARQGP